MTETPNHVFEVEPQYVDMRVGDDLAFDMLVDVTLEKIQKTQELNALLRQVEALKIQDTHLHGQAQGFLKVLGGPSRIEDALADNWRGLQDKVREKLDG